MKSLRYFLFLLLILVMPLQTVAASFQLVCQDNHKTSMTIEKKVSHCHQVKNKEQNHVKDYENYNISHHCLSFCAQLSMSALTQNFDLVFSQDNIMDYSQYLYYYDSVTLPHIERPPISFS